MLRLAAADAEGFPIPARPPAVHMPTWTLIDERLNKMIGDSPH
jgi:hypothetical protein